MKFTTASMIALTSALSAAQTVTRSAPFNLFVTSKDGKYKNAPVQSCHSGAAIEALCLNQGTAVYHFNATSYPDFTAGILTWTLPSEPQVYDQGLGFYLPYTTNVAQAMFGQPLVQVSFDKNNKLNILDNYDDSVTPPNADGNATAHYRWHACQTNYEGYSYETINWVYGSKPHNPSCVQVDVKRVFTK